MRQMGQTLVWSRGHKNSTCIHCNLNFVYSWVAGGTVSRWVVARIFPWGSELSPRSLLSLPSSPPQIQLGVWGRCKPRPQTYFHAFTTLKAHKETVQYSVLSGPRGPQVSATGCQAGLTCKRQNDKHGLTYL